MTLFCRKHTRQKLMPSARISGVGDWLTVEKNIFPPDLPGMELATFRSRVRRSNSALAVPTRWYVQHAAIWHWYLLLRNYIFLLLLFLSISFYTFFFKFCIDKSTEWSTIPACPSLMCFFLTGAIPKGLILQKICVWYFCIFCFMWVCVRTDFVVYG